MTALRPAKWWPAGSALATASVIRFALPAAPAPRTGRINWLGAALLGGWLVALLLPVSKAALWGWGSARVIGLLTAASILIVCWVFAESRSSNPLIDLRVMRLPAVWTTNLTALLSGTGVSAVFAFLPQFVETPKHTGYGFGATVSRAGLLMLPMLVTMFLAGIASGRITRFVPARMQLVIGALLGALGCGILTFAHGHQGNVVLAAAVFGVGIGLSYSSMAPSPTSDASCAAPPWPT